MILLQCIAEAVMSQGLKGLFGLVPMGDQIYEIAKQTIENYKKQRKDEQLRQDAEQIIQARMDEVVLHAKKIAEEVAVGRPQNEIDQLERYLTLVPSTIRQSMKRPADPSGTTVPASISLADPIQLGNILPKRLPKFQVDDTVPNAPQWQFVSLLGVGGFGEVWLARHSFMNQLRAFKFCLEVSARDRLLKHEGSVVKQVMEASKNYEPNRSSIVPLVDAMLEGDSPWLAYEYIDGGDLSRVLDELKTMHPEQAALLVLQLIHDVAEVVGKFHRLPIPIIHRDLKPANILVRKLTNRWVLKVTDFGISHISSEQKVDSTLRTTPKQSLGDTIRGAHTPIYASPQQKKYPPIPADVRDDVYAIGIIAYQLLIGDLSAERPSRGWRKKVSVCKIPAEVLDLLESCWDDDPNDRPQDGLVLAEKLVSLGVASSAEDGSSDRTVPQSHSSKSFFIEAAAPTMLTLPPLASEILEQENELLKFEAILRSFDEGSHPDYIPIRKEAGAGDVLLHELFKQLKTNLESKPGQSAAELCASQVNVPPRVVTGVLAVIVKRNDVAKSYETARLEFHRSQESDFAAIIEDYLAPRADRAFPLDAWNQISKDLEARRYRFARTQVELLRFAEQVYSRMIAEELKWGKITSSKSLSECMSYLDEFPNGRHQDEVRQLIAALNEEKEADDQRKKVELERQRVEFEKTKSAENALKAKELRKRIIGRIKSGDMASKSRRSQDRQEYLSYRTPELEAKDTGFPWLQLVGVQVLVLVCMVASWGIFYSLAYDPFLGKYSWYSGLVPAMVQMLGIVAIFVLRGIDFDSSGYQDDLLIILLSLLSAAALNILIYAIFGLLVNSVSVYLGFLIVGAKAVFDYLVPVDNKHSIRKYYSDKYYACFHIVFPAMTAAGLAGFFAAYFWGENNLFVVDIVTYFVFVLLMFGFARYYLAPRSLNAKLLGPLPWWDSQSAESAKNHYL